MKPSVVPEKLRCFLRTRLPPHRPGGRFRGLRPGVVSGAPSWDGRFISEVDGGRAGGQDPLGLTQQTWGGVDALPSPLSQ